MKIRNIVRALLMSCTSFAFVAAANDQGDSSYPEVSPL